MRIPGRMQGGISEVIFEEILKGVLENFLKESKEPSLHIAVRNSDLSTRKNLVEMGAPTGIPE